MTSTKSGASKAASKGSGSKSAEAKKSGGKAYEKSSRCWPGYVPVPGKGEHEEGSCRPKPASKNAGKSVDRETARHKQIARGGKRAEQAKGKSPNAAERKTVSKAAKSHRGAAPAKEAAKSSGAKKTGAAKATGAKKTSTRSA